MTANPDRQLSAQDTETITQAIRQTWPEADSDSIANIIGSATRSSRPLLGHQTAQGNQVTFDCVCVNPYHHLSNEDLVAAGHWPTEIPLWGDPDPAKALDIAQAIARAANERYQENRAAQADGTTNALGIKPPEGWRARYDGDY